MAKLTDEQTDAIIEVVTQGSILLSTIIKVAFDKLSEHEAKSILPVQAKTLIATVDAAAAKFE